MDKLASCNPGLLIPCLFPPQFLSFTAWVGTPPFPKACHVLLSSSAEASCVTPLWPKLLYLITYVLVRAAVTENH